MYFYLVCVFLFYDSHQHTSVVSCCSFDSVLHLIWGHRHLHMRLHHCTHIQVLPWHFSLKRLIAFSTGIFTCNLCLKNSTVTAHSFFIY